MAQKTSLHGGQTFENVLAKAQEACQNADIEVADHFTGVSKTIPMPKGASKDINDFMLTQDLRSFWSTTYFDVRKELKRRYPKHAWPENPNQ